MSPSPISVRQYFARLRDPRLNRRKRHLLIDTIVIALCAVICGANDWQQVAAFAKRRLAWLKTFLALGNGIPSHDTLERAFGRLDPAAFLACFQQRVAALARSLEVGHIAIDGKTLRRSGNAPKGRAPLHVVSAWATQCHLTLTVQRYGRIFSGRLSPRIGGAQPGGQSHDRTAIGCLGACVG